MNSPRRFDRTMKRFVTIMVGILCVVPMLAQDMKTVFVAMPDSIAPLLTKVNREDCIDFLASNMAAKVQTRFGSVAEMKVLTDDYTLMQISPVSTMELKLLPLNDSTKVICMVKTVSATASDSDVRFYTSDWKEKLDARSFFSKPQASDFFLPTGSLTDEEALLVKKADMHLMKASLSKDSATLAFAYTTPDYLNKEDREKLSPYLRKEPLVLRWEQGKFVRQGDIQ